MRFRNLKKQAKQKKQEETTKQMQYARIPDRIKAFITDLFMIYVPILYIITYIFMDGAKDFQGSQMGPLIGVSIYALIYAFMLSKFGQTPGKKAYNIKVVNSNDSTNIGFIRALFRFIAFLFSATTLLGLFFSFYRKDKKSLHDIIVNTTVIELKEI